MEEIRRLAREYYQNTVNIRYFGRLGGLYLLVSLPFIVVTFYTSLAAIELQNFSVILMIVCAVLWSMARKEYNKSLVRQLSYYTHSNSHRVDEQKAHYLLCLTGHIGNSLLESLKACKEIVETERANRGFAIDNGWYHFGRFLYNSEAKNRILSLVIYLFSLIALITIAKSENTIDIYVLVESISFEMVRNYLIMIIFGIILLYGLVVVPIMFIISFVVIPIALLFSSRTALSRHFISELNRYAFVDTRTEQE